MKPNILFIVIDSFSAKKCFGKNKTSITPNIDNLIKQGTYFSQTISASSSTVLSFGSIFTGLYPFESVIRENNYFKIDPKKITYIENLIDFGYNAYATLPKIFTFVGLEKIFQREIETYDSFENLYNGVGEQILDSLNSKNLQEPWLYYLHLMDLHGTETSFLSDPPEEFSDKKFGINRYDRMVSAMDVWLGKILEKIDLEKTLIILTADHGADSASWTPEMEKFAQYNIENRKVESGTLHKISMKVPKSLIPFRKKLSDKYREKRDQTIQKKIQPEIEKIVELDLTPYEKRVMQNAIGSIPKVYEEMCHVPLIISGFKIPNKIIEQLVSSIDIFPTIAEIVNMPKNNGKIHGQSLLPLINDKTIEERPVYIESDIDSSSKTNVIGIRTSKYKYFRSGDSSTVNQHLYDLQTDALEENNIANENPKTVEDMESILQKLKNNSYMQSDQKQIDEDKRKKIQEELKKLGYIS
ncbi:sulfatase family protein [Nitrosopumilus ureiphilus]|uniref:sulfatase family protein n=1 Tax=Nitrosopumilus ureiphilus TaxID=1470067 RepID=UPI0015CE5097|nr:sulfatase-like hydrolase/transferase [Nitrosopumilus ureiphilus]